MLFEETLSALCPHVFGWVSELSLLALTQEESIRNSHGCTVKRSTQLSDTAVDVGYFGSINTLIILRFIFVPSLHGYLPTEILNYLYTEVCIFSLTCTTSPHTHSPLSYLENTWWIKWMKKMGNCFCFNTFRWFFFKIYTVQRTDSCPLICGSISDPAGPRYEWVNVTLKWALNASPFS